MCALFIGITRTHCFDNPSSLATYVLPNAVTLNENGDDNEEYDVEVVAVPGGGAGGGGGGAAAAAAVVVGASALLPAGVGAGALPPPAPPAGAAAAAVGGPPAAVNGIPKLTEQWQEA